MKPNIISEKSVAFAINMIKVYQSIVKAHNEYILSKQFLRSSTAIGALVKEAEHAQSTPDFIHKMHIALKEANETEYWLLLLNKGGYLSDEEHTIYTQDASELIRILASIVKTTKLNLKDAKK
ncbi:hypothetical protein EMGBS15_09560 [Filimonas sp.]|nr:hypothetical protein EMGBS15_09560 [Filimonas sp.]